MSSRFDGVIPTTNYQLVCSASHGGKEKKKKKKTSLTSPPHGVWKVQAYAAALTLCSVDIFAKRSSWWCPQLTPGQSARWSAVNFPWAGRARNGTKTQVACIPPCSPHPLPDRSLPADGKHNARGNGARLRAQFFIVVCRRGDIGGRAG